MDSSNLRHHQHLLGSSSSSSSSSLATPPCYEIATSITNLNDGNQLINQIDQNYNSRQKNDIFQQWTSNNVYNNNSHDHLNHARIKDESFSSSSSSTSEYSFPRFTEILTSSSRDLNDLSDKLLLQTLSPGFQMFSPENHHFFTSRAQNGAGSSSVPCISGNFSQIYPSVNISNLNQLPSSSSENISDLQALDLLPPPARFSSRPSFDPLLMHQSSHATANLNKMSLSSTLTEPKRSPRSLPEPKPAAAKKSRVENRTSCPPFKVRKEKLGDRVASLQQLVAPYGKTDTASVLMEAIGYIKFLQNQVETLSVPYMKLSRNKSINRSKQGGTTMEEGNSGDPGQGLRSRGLCLVPLSCMSYLDGDGGGSMWPPPNFGGGGI